MDILAIQNAIREDNVFFTEHAVQQMAKRGIDDDEVLETILSGEIIEEYPADKYGPSCLIYGQTDGGRHLHVVSSLPPRVRIITVYEPDSDEWLNNRRKKK